jgi:hypothetical protein
MTVKRMKTGKNMYVALESFSVHQAEYLQRSTFRRSQGAPSHDEAPE